jgi:mRNA degradation ribonuclease J1/J2
LEPYKEIVIDDFDVTTIPVDHPLPGALSYFIEANESNRLYWRLRFHRKQELK